LKGRTYTTYSFQTHSQETVTILPRTDYFTNYIGERYKLGTAIPVTINKGVNDLPDTVLVNGIKLSKGVFDGKFFPNHQITISGIAPEGKEIKGWKIIAKGANGASETVTDEGSELTITIDANCASLTIEAVLSSETGISKTSAQSQWKWQRTAGGINVSNVPEGQKVSIYDLRGVQLSEAISNGSNIFLPAAAGQLYILKVGSESVKIQ